MFMKANKISQENVYLSRRDISLIAQRWEKIACMHMYLKVMYS